MHSRHLQICKQAFLYTVLLISFQRMQAQVVVNTTGASLTVKKISIEYSIGEIAIATLSSIDNHTTQGVLQPVLKVDVNRCITLDYVPTAFSPNNDGLNDCYNVSHWPFTNSFELSIFSRPGQLLFRTTDTRECWDGRYNGVAQAVGPYPYVIRSNTDCGPIVKTGTIMLIR